MCPIVLQIAHYTAQYALNGNHLGLRFSRNTNQEQQDLLGMLPPGTRLKAVQLPGRVSSKVPCCSFYVAAPQNCDIYSFLIITLSQLPRVLSTANFSPSTSLPQANAIPTHQCGCCCMLLQDYELLGEGVISLSSTGEKMITMLPFAHHPDPLNIIRSLFPYSKEVQRPPPCHQLDSWPHNWLSQTHMDTCRVPVSMVVKSLPAVFIQDCVADPAERQELVQFAQQGLDLDIHLQVRRQQFH